ncbi:MAG: hypothetical protein IPP54_05360 [Anaerolineales bacterium]|nr:hypothetical protein [Anaerolineales bacterium]
MKIQSIIPPVDFDLPFHHFLPAIRFASRDSVYRNTNNKHNNRPPLDAGVRRNWRMDRKPLRYQTAFARL